MGIGKLQNLTIVYIEDDQLTRENTLEILQRKCDNVFVAKNGIEGFDLYKEKKPDIIITDIQMPKMDGITMAKKIRKEDLETLMIITTAYTDQKYLLDAVELQLVKYISKPLTWDKISSSLQACLRYIKEEPQTKHYFDKSTYFDVLTKSLFEGSESIYLTNNERELLNLLCRYANNAVSYEEIEYTIWQEKGMSTDAIKSLTKSLRKKLPKGTIKNLYGMGYKLKVVAHNEKK